MRLISKLIAFVLVLLSMTVHADTPLQRPYLLGNFDARGNAVTNAFFQGDGSQITNLPIIRISQYTNAPTLPYVVTNNGVLIFYDFINTNVSSGGGGSSSNALQIIQTQFSGGTVTITSTNITTNCVITASRGQYQGIAFVNENLTNRVNGGFGVVGSATFVSSYAADAGPVQFVILSPEAPSLTGALPSIGGTATQMKIVASTFTGVVNGASAQYYVNSTNGNDGSDGITPETAWLTPQHANLTATSNSVIWLAGSNNVNLTPLVLTNALTWTSYGSSQALFSSTNYLAPGIIIIRGSGITLSNLSIQGTTNFVTNYVFGFGSGVYCSAGAVTGSQCWSNNSVIGCSFDNLSQATFFNMTNGSGGEVNVALNYNTVSNCGYSGLYINAFDQGKTRVLSTNVTIIGNNITKIFGIPDVDSGSGIVVTSATNVVIQNNYVHDNGQSQDNPGAGGAGGIVVVWTWGFDISYNWADDIWNASDHGEDGVGIDADIASRHGAIHDNLATRCYGAGYDFFSSWGDIVFYHNLSDFNAVDFLQGTSPGEQNAEVSINNSDLTDSAGITNLSIYSNMLVGSYSAPVRFATFLAFGANYVSNNIFVTETGNPIAWDGPNTTFLINNYWATGNGVPYIFWNNVTYGGILAWQTATSQDPQARSLNPYQDPMYTGWPDQTFFAIWDRMSHGLFFSPNNGPSISTVATGNLFIAGAGNASLTSTNNYLDGTGVGGLNTTGSYNTMKGAFAFQGNKTGSENSGYGLGVLESNISGSHNTASGEGALGDNIDGAFNTASGEFALLFGIHGSNNTASGFNAQVHGISNQFDTSFGMNSLLDSTNSSHNTAMGDNALSQLLGGTYNIAIGSMAGSDLIANESSNIYVGNVGVAGENQTTRIGTDGVQTNAYISGTLHANLGPATNLPPGGLQAGTAGYMVITDANGHVVYSNLFPANLLFTNQPYLNQGATSTNGWLTNGFFVQIGNQYIAWLSNQDLYIGDGANIVGKLTNGVLTANALVMADGNKALYPVTLGTGLAFSGSTLNATGGSGTFPGFNPNQADTNGAGYVEIKSGALLTNTALLGTPTNTSGYPSLFSANAQPNNGSGLTNLQVTNVVIGLQTNQLTVVNFVKGDGTTGTGAGITNLNAICGITYDTVSSNDICFSNLFNCISNENYIHFFVHTTNSAGVHLSFAGHPTLLAGLTNGFLLTNSTGDFSVFGDIVGTNWQTNTAHWWISNPNY